MICARKPSAIAIEASSFARITGGICARREGGEGGDGRRADESLGCGEPPQKLERGCAAAARRRRSGGTMRRAGTAAARLVLRCDRVPVSPPREASAVAAAGGSAVKAVVQEVGGERGQIN